MFYKYLIIGGGIAGTTAAETIRENDPMGSIAVIGDEKYPLYSRLSLFDWICDESYGDKIFLRNLNQYKEKNINLLLGARVEKIDVTKKEVYLSDGQVLKFEKLLIASGGAPLRLAVEGREENVFYYQNLDDAKRIREKLIDIKKVAVIGASFAAFEIVELFRQFDIEVDMFAREQFLGGNINEGLQEYIKDVLKNKKVNLKFGINIKKIESSEKGAIIYASSERYEYDGIVITVGLGRNFNIFEKAGIKCNKGILTDEYLRTNISDIYAAGDVAEYFDINEQSYILSGSWTGAFMQGKIAGKNMVESRSLLRIEMTPIYTCRIFDDQFVFLGPGRQRAEDIEMIARNDLRNGKYIIYHIKESIIKGAVLMNSNEKQTEIMRQIREKIVLHH